MDIDHVYETLKVGIDTLAAGTGSIQERLWETWTVIHTLNEDEQCRRCDRRGRNEAGLAECFSRQKPIDKWHLALAGYEILGLH